MILQVKAEGFAVFGVVDWGISPQNHPPTVNLK